MEDRRIYLHTPGWIPTFKQDDSRMFCHLANESDGYYHLISVGELYFVQGTESYCVNCALKKEIVTCERPHLRLRAPDDLMATDEE